MSGAGVTPTGKVTVKEGSKTLASVSLSSTGRGTVSLPRLKAGTHKLTVVYSGDSLWNTARTSSSVKITR